jgi:hypothetical protein
MIFTIAVSQIFSIKTVLLLALKLLWVPLVLLWSVTKSIILGGLKSIIYTYKYIRESFINFYCFVFQIDQKIQKDTFRTSRIRAKERRIHFEVQDNEKKHAVCKNYKNFTKNMIKKLIFSFFENIKQFILLVLVIQVVSHLMLDNKIYNMIAQIINNTFSKDP